MSDDSIHEGGCLCGAVRYRVTGEPRWVAHCHCRDCRRASGGAVVTWAGFSETAYETIAGEPALHASSPGVSRGFCAACGSPMTFQSTRWPGETHVGVGTLDEPGDFPPKAHVYAGERLPWLHIDEHLKSFDKTPQEKRP